MGGATPLSASSLRAHSDLNPRKASLGGAVLVFKSPLRDRKEGKEGRGEPVRMDGGSGCEP